mmetsp:Transcript_70462/g.139659  ORF Transcript_70462/g.139659 Transcript_70462/m.139659 type:complete len:247 (+) Transcript_70462:20-760(+)
MDASRSLLVEVCQPRLPLLEQVVRGHESRMLLLEGSQPRAQGARLGRRSLFRLRRPSCLVGGAPQFGAQLALRLRALSKSLLEAPHLMTSGGQCLLHLAHLSGARRLRTGRGHLGRATNLDLAATGIFRGRHAGSQLLLELRHSLLQLSHLLLQCRLRPLSGGAPFGVLRHSALRLFLLHLRSLLRLVCLLKSLRHLLQLDLCHGRARHAPSYLVCAAAAAAEKGCLSTRLQRRRHKLRVGSRGSL